MAEIQSDIEKLHSDVRLVSFSVDPEYDTPVVLSAYAAHAHADPARWSFVTGPVDDVSRTVVLGFKVSAAKVARKAGDYDVTHGNWLVLVDRECHVRGYYSAEPSDSARLVVDDAVRLERQVR
jgi:protein SCO1/2